MTSSMISINMEISEENIDKEEIFILADALKADLEELGAESVDHQKSESIEKDTKGDPITIGALLLVALPVILEKIFDYIQKWTVEGRTVKIKAGDREIEFSSGKRYSKEEIFEIVKELEAL